MSELPQDGWWPEESDAPMTQMLSVGGRRIANIIKQTVGWQAFSLIELNASKTGGNPLADSVLTREEARKQAEDYAHKLAVLQ